MNTARIPFNLKLTEGNYKGEAIGIGDSLQNNCMFEVRLLNGNSFLLKAEEDKEIRRYNWTTQSQNILHKLVPVIGKVIERFFAKN